MTLSAQKDDFNKARNCCFRLLKIRDRSEKEIRTRLSQKKYSQEIINQTIQFLTTSELLDDRQFTKKWIQARLARPLGLKRIHFELKQKGISDDLIREGLSQLDNTYREEEIVFSLIKKRMPRYRTLDPVKRRQRLFGYLARRGFNPEIINNGLKKFYKTEDTRNA